VAAVDFIRTIDPKDTDTAGLFGCGAGAMIVERTRDDDSRGLWGLYWENQTKYWDLGTIKILDANVDDRGVNLKLDFYRMKGQELAKIAMKALPKLLDDVLQQARWTFNDVDLIVTHQPNLRLLEIAARFLKTDRFLMSPVAEVGNLGPASVLAALSHARESRMIQAGSKILLMSFGLGFSCGASAIAF
jgi:3-oxoacyl-[acyl-carrier-protein] synthase-3